MKEINLTTEDGYRFQVIKEVDDPMTNRLSVGGSKEEGCYVVYRGPTQECINVLEQALEAMKKAQSVNYTQNN